MPSRSKFAAGSFCAWDGEGAAVQGRHEYVALLNSAGDVRTAAGGLESEATLGWLADRLAQDARQIHVGFAFSYDANMLLRDVPRAVLQQLWDDGLTYWGAFRLEYRPRKMFGVWERRYTPGQKGRWVGGRIWDVFGFFQSSFVQALESYGIGTPEERAEIQRMKLLRADFTPAELEGLVVYSQLECRLLVQLMESVRTSAQAAGLTFRRWDGAGVAAAAWLQREQVKQHLGPDPATVSPRWPEAVRDAGQWAYFGGRIECGQIGHHRGKVWQYDIRSAYPDALRRLPTFAPETGAWVHNPPEPWRYTVGVHRVRWNFQTGARAYPFPFRTSDGAVFFPPQGEGWYWAPEVRAAFAARRLGGVEGDCAVLDSWCWIPAASHPSPFAGLAFLYAQRAEWKRTGQGAEKMAKLAINSCYGKLAQQLGGGPGQAPSYHCLEAAGWVTSYVRARLYRAAVEAGDAWIMLATDAIYTTRPLPRLEESITDELGDWDREIHQTATAVQSGVYWVGRDGGELHHFRGFDPDSLERQAVRDAWARGERQVLARSTRFQTIGACVGSAKAFEKWRTWKVTVRKLDLQPRAGQKRLHRGAVRALAQGLQWTTPRQPVAAEGWQQRLISCPVAVPWRRIAEAVEPGQLPALTRAEEEADDVSM